MTKKIEIVAEDDGLDLFTLFKTSRNKDLEENGKWFPLGNGTAFKVRSFRSKAVADLQERLNKPFVNLQRAGLEIPEAQQEEIGLRVISEAILVDWKRVKNADNQFVDYSPEEAYATIKALPRLGALLTSWSMDLAQFEDELKDESVKNS